MYVFKYPIFGNIMLEKKVNIPLKALIGEIYQILFKLSLNRALLFSQ